MVSGGGSNKQTSKWLFRHGLEQHSTIKDVHLYGAEVQHSVQSMCWLVRSQIGTTDEKEDTEASCLPPSCSTLASCPPPASTQTHSHSGQSKEATIARSCSDLGLNALKEKAGAGRESNNGLRLRREWWAQLESVGTTGQLPTPPSVLCLLLLRTGPAQYPSIGGIKTAFHNWECNEENTISI